ncbi:MAG: hypothetical protein Crog4KO_18940 [Crocinitomicaceae bacterium]
MDEITIKKRLYEIALSENGNLLENEIAVESIETEDPIKYLEDMYRNNGLKYDLPDVFFETFTDEILEAIEEARIKVKWMMHSKNYAIELSFLAYQLTLEKMMVHFGLISTEDTFFADYDILDVHGETSDGKTIRYGISDIEISTNQTPSRYVQVRNERGQLLTEAEVYFIEEKSDENNL